MTDEDPTGFAQIPRWLQRDKTVSPWAKLVYLALASRADRYGQARPSRALIADECSCSVATVKRALDELTALGVISRTTRRRDDGGQTSNTYTLHVGARRPDQPTTLPEPTPHPDPEPVDNEVDNDRPSDEARLPVNRGAAHPEPGGGSPRTTKNETQKNETQKNDPSSHPAAPHVPPTPDDGPVPPAPTPPRPPGTQLDIPTLAAALETATGRTPSNFAVHAVAGTVLERGARRRRRITDPTAYVTAAIRNDPFTWQQFLDRRTDITDLKGVSA